MTDDFYTYEETLAAQAAQRSSPQPHIGCLNYHYITTTRELETAILPFATCQTLSIDTETTGLDPYTDRIRLVQVAASNLPTLVIDLWAVHDWSALQHLLAANARKVGHTLKFDWQMLYAAGLPLAGPYFDTQLAYQVLRAGIQGKSSLKVVVKQLFGMELDKGEQRSDFGRARLSERQIRYAAWDAAYALAVFRSLVNRLRHRSTQWNARLLAIAQLEANCIPATAWMELNGMGIDLEQWKLTVHSLQAQKHSALVAFQSALGESYPQQGSLFPDLANEVRLGTNPGSSRQVIKALARHGVVLKATDQRSVIRKVDQHPALPHLLAWRRVAKILDSVEGLPNHQHPQTQRLHPSIYQLGARSGRLICKRPALQTIPHLALVRRCFTAAPGHVLIKADYNQIELRIIAKLTRDPLLVKAYQTQQDIHRLTASLLMDKPIESVTDEERTLAKSINFGLIYGMSAVRLQLETQLKYGIVLSHAQALAFHRHYFTLFKGVTRWHERSKRALYRHQQRVARTLLGRVRRWQATPSFNEFVNFPVQGTSVDVTKLALVALIPYLSPEVKLVMVVHDEIVLEVPEERAQALVDTVRHCMVSAATPILAPIPVAVSVRVSKTWAGD